MSRQLWSEQTQANCEARQILGIGREEVVVGDLPEEAFRYAIAKGSAENLKELDKKYGLEGWYKSEEELLGLYFCGKCNHDHYFDSKVGIEHKKHHMHWLIHAQKDREFYRSFDYVK